MTSFPFRLLTAAGAVCILAACGQSPKAPEEPVALFKHTGARQCETQTGSADRLRAEQAELERAGVQVVTAQCGLDQQMYPAVCGGGTGDVWLITVKPDAVAAAQSRGYRAPNPAQPIDVQNCR